MYGLPGSRIQFGVKSAAKKRGRPSAQSKFLEQQKDLFPVDLYTSRLHGRDINHFCNAANAADAPPQAATSAGFAAAFDLGFSDLRRCSTADQSGVPDFEDCRDGH
jgi:hypothetical protein